MGRRITKTKVVGIRTDRCVKIGEIGGREGLGDILVRRVIPEGQVDVAYLSPNLLLSEIVGGVAVNGTIHAAEQIQDGTDANGTKHAFSDLDANGAAVVNVPITPGSVSISTILDDGGTDVPITLTDGPIPVTGEVGVANYLQSGLDGQLRDANNTVYGRINYFDGTWSIDFVLPVKANEAIEITYRETATFKANGQIVAPSFPTALVVSPIPMDVGATLWMVADTADITVRCEIGAIVDGNALAQTT